MKTKLFLSLLIGLTSCTTTGRTLTKTGGKLGNFGREQIVKTEGTKKEFLGNLVAFVPVSVGYGFYYVGGFISRDKLEVFPPDGKPVKNTK